MPKESNFRMNIRLKNLALLETDETAPTLTLAAKAQKILSSLFYSDPWMAASWHKSCTRLCVIPSQVGANPVANHPRRLKWKSLCAKYSRQKKIKSTNSRKQNPHSSDLSHALFPGDCPKVCRCIAILLVQLHQLNNGFSLFPCLLVSVPLLYFSYFVFYLSSSLSFRYVLSTLTKASTSLAGRVRSSHFFSRITLLSNL